MLRNIPQLKKKTGTALVLSGGATKAFCFYLGVLRVLEEQGEDISSIIGTSAGAIAGGFFASGVSADTIISSLSRHKTYIPKHGKWVRPITASTLFRPMYGEAIRQSLTVLLRSLRFVTSLPWLLGRDIVAEAIDELVNSQTELIGLFNASELEYLFETLLPTQEFTHTDIDLYVTATVLDRPHLRAVFNGIYSFEDEVNTFITGVPLSRAIRASAAIPAVFEPVKIGDRYYVDGEVKQTLSADIGLGVSDRVIVAHVYQPLQSTGKRSVRDMGWLNVFKQSLFAVFYERIATWRYLYSQQNPSKEIIWIEPDPHDVEFFSAPDFSFRPEVQKLMIEKGANAALLALAKSPAAVHG